MGVAAAFDRAADYDAHAGVQRRVAAGLADDIVALTNGTADRVLELGCGTGFVGQALAGRLQFNDYLATDIAPAMVARTAARLGHIAHMRFATMDAAAPSGGPYDLICSSLALQWLDDLAPAVRRLGALVTPGGRLIFTTLAANSFAEWRAAHREAEAGTPAYPSAATLGAMGLEVMVAPVTQAYPNARAFLRTLKAIGAGTPRPGYRPLAPAALRAAMARFEAAGASVTYQVATCHMTRARDDA